MMRSKHIMGPYEEKVVMAQGKTNINGPHQGAWVTTVSGEDWFINFQDKGAYGRVVHLNPMVWKNDWPVIGIDKDGDGSGEPVTSYKKPDVGKIYPVTTINPDDEFDTPQTGLQWQWHANKKVTWGFPSGSLGYFRLNCIPEPEEFVNLWSVPSLLLQKLSAEEFTATCKLTFKAYSDNEKAGLVVMGTDYASFCLKRENGQLNIVYSECVSADRGNSEKVLKEIPVKENEVFFRVKVEKGALCHFSYSSDGENFRNLDHNFTARPGKWIGAKIGFFALRKGFTNNAGYADIDWFRVTGKQDAE